ncbi:hybrid sensor histidine kinase/response regulator [Telmatospirillum sp.]|uniref:hybrid sensor histidine kinase/response regulator n=1 Tax=Telmatospirillum sp. TaxID=2079197 RepID=UPI00284EF6AF|nr:hybrid sensor histidine kinase/response regulator [Telmatospirillum sp.]MDR3439988.1 hybrid sensor histidine kinase/response regulator [Telmatospirillum sp.]
MTPTNRDSLHEDAVSSRERIAAEQIEIMFRFVTVAVLAAALFAVMLALIIAHLGYLNPMVGFCWVGYIVACACSHIVLFYFYRRSESARARWRYWAALFTIISLAEGCGWGWASINLATGGGFEIASLMVLAAGGVAAGSIPAFNPFLPTLFTFVLTSTLPYTFVSLASADKVQQATSPMVLLYIGVLCCLGILANSALRQSIGLRIKTEQMATELMRQKEIAEQANRAKSNFLAAASHDLRQPVHALGLFVGALSLVPMPLEGQRLVERIDESTNALDNLFAALIDISRLDAGVVAANCRPFAIGPVLDRVCRDFAGEATNKGLILSCMPCRAIVESDPTLVERIARNLVSNAVRYTDRGRIVVGCRRRGSHIAMQVWDTGRGIPPHEQSHIFQEYYQIGNPERDREKGLGLGLAIVRRLADLLACKLVLQSKSGHGSCFEVSLARSTRAATSLMVPAVETSILSSTGFVVVVDDERAIREGMSSLLTGWGYDVLTAASADEAIKALAARMERPDLLICDLRLRGENGIEVIEILRAEYNEQIPAMLITGDTGADQLIDAHASGFVLLHKPVPNGKMRAVITRLISAGLNEQFASGTEV